MCCTVIYHISFINSSSHIKAVKLLLFRISFSSSISLPMPNNGTSDCLRTKDTWGWRKPSTQMLTMLQTEKSINSSSTTRYVRSFSFARTDNERRSWRYLISYLSDSLLFYIFPPLIHHINHNFPLFYLHLFYPGCCAGKLSTIIKSDISCLQPSRCVSLTFTFSPLL